MRLIILLVSLFLVWKLTSYYLDRSLELTSTNPPTVMEKAGAADVNMATSSQPVFQTEINKAMNVEEQLKEAQERRKGY